MEKMNGMPGFAIQDYEDTPYYHLIKKLPLELAKNHLHYIEAEVMTDEQAIEYLSEIVANRTEAMRKSEISDTSMREAVAGHEAALFRSLETTVFHNPDNYLGTGMTAKVKLFNVQTQDLEQPVISMAVKYVVTPTAKTISAEQEHNVIKEVERMRAVEAAEIAFPNRSKYIRVPHPYLFHSTDTIQLYGMEHVDGITLEQAMRDGMLHFDMKESLRNSRLAEVTPEEMDGYIKRFFDTMHEYCLHGDIKLRNIMVNRDGVLYIIDFGQSILSQNFDDKVQENFENLKEDEIKITQNAVRSLLRKVFAEET